MKKTKVLAISSLMAAMCVAILSIGSILESLDVSLAIAAGLVILILSSEYGDKTALSVYLVAGLLSLLLPVKSPALMFLALGGWYPLAQKRINRLKKVTAFFLKAMIFNFVLASLLLLSAFVLGVVELPWAYAVLFLLGNACFFLYDRLLDRFLLWYQLKLRHRLKF